MSHEYIYSSELTRLGTTPLDSILEIVSIQQAMLTWTKKSHLSFVTLLGQPEVPVHPTDSAVGRTIGTRITMQIDLVTKTPAAVDGVGVGNQG